MSPVPVVIHLDELSPFREATTLRQRVGLLSVKHPLKELEVTGPDLDTRMWFAAMAACSSIAGAMRSRDPRKQVHLLRDADAALTELRGYAYDALAYAGW